MLLITVLIPIIIIEVNAVSGLSINPRVVCNESQYVEYNHKAVISCEYDKRFYAVRWYLNNSTESFVRIDGTFKIGSGLETGEYDIEEDGSMVIKRVDFGNEGQYTVSVLSVDGIFSKARIVVHVFVPLRELTVHYCNVSTNEVCKEAGVTEEKTAVICIAKNTKPQVELTWQTLDGMTESPVSSMTNVTLKLNDTMPLYSAYSVIKYDSNLFTMQYFTCIASGSAVRDVSNASLLVKGHKPFDEVTHRETYAVKGESLPLQCPHASDDFGQLSVTLLNGSSNLILVWNSLTQLRQCSSRWVCEISTSGLERVVMPAYDISFECISSSGVKTTKDVIHVTIDESECHVTNGGLSSIVITFLIVIIIIFVLVAAIFIWRKGLLICKPDTSKLDDAEENNEMTLPELSDTDQESTPLLPEQKEFDELFKPFYEKVVACRAADAEFQRLLAIFAGANKNVEVRTLLGTSIHNFNPSKEDLIVIINFFSASKWISSDGILALLQVSLEMEQLPTKVGLDLIHELFTKENINSNVYARITKYLIEHRKMKADDFLKRLKSTTTETKHPQTIIAEVLLHYYVLNVLTTKGIDKTIQMGFEKSKDKIPYLFLLLVIEGEYNKSQNKKELLELFNNILAKAKTELGYNGMQFVESPDVGEPDIRKAISSSIIFIVDKQLLKLDTLMDILQYSCLNDKVTKTLFTTVLLNLLQQEKIVLYRYISEVKTCLVQHKITESEFAQLLSALLKDGKISIFDFITEIKECRFQNVIKEDEFTQLLSSLVKYEQFTLDEYITGLKDCVKRKVITKEALVMLLPKALECQTVNQNDYLNALKNFLQKKLINENNFADLVSNFLQHMQVSFKEYAIELRTCCRDNLISKDDVVRILSNLMQHKEIYIQDFLEEVKSCKEESVISDEDIQHIFMACVKSDNADVKTLVECTIFLSKEKMISDENVMLIMTAIVDKFEVTKQDMKTLMENSQKDVSVYKKIMKMKMSIIDFE